MQPNAQPRSNIAQVPALAFCIVFLPFFSCALCVCFFLFFQNHHLTFRFHCCFLSELLADTECWCWCWCCWCKCWCGIARCTAGCYFTYACQFSHFFFWFKLINSLLYVRQGPARHKYTRREWKRNTILLQRVKSHLLFHEISSEFSCLAYLLDKLEWLKSTIQLKMRDSTQKRVVKKRRLKSRCKLQINFNKNSPIGIKCQHRRERENSMHFWRTTQLINFEMRTGKKRSFI